MAFRLTTLFYFTALVAAALAAFGMWGLFVAPLVPIALWCVHWLGNASGVAIAKVFAILAAAVLSYQLLWPKVFINPYIPSRESSLRLEEFSYGINRLNQQNALATDQHSWRVRVLPGLIDVASGLSPDYRFDEAWDSEHNKRVMSGGAAIYQRDSHYGGDATHYLAIVDARCAWTPHGLLKAAQIADGAENTLLLVDTTSFDIPWSEPRDLTYDEALELLTTVPSAETQDWYIANHGYFMRHQRFRLGVLCDGRVVRLRIPLDRATANALLTANGGEEIDWNRIDPRSFKEIDYPKIVALAVFIGLVVSPIHRGVWRRIAPRWVKEQEDFARGEE
jgi:hypothetical protein